MNSKQRCDEACSMKIVAKRDGAAVCKESNGARSVSTTWAVRAFILDLEAEDQSARGSKASIVEQSDCFDRRFELVDLVDR